MALQAFRFCLRKASAAEVPRMRIGLEQQVELQSGPL